MKKGFIIVASYSILQSLITAAMKAQSMFTIGTTRSRRRFESKEKKRKEIHHSFSVALTAYFAFCDFVSLCIQNSKSIG
jgi:hypothetical protein